MRGIIVMNGEFAGVIEKPTKEEFDVFREGLMEGVGLCGTSGCGLYAVEDIFNGMLNEEDEGDSKIIQLIRAHLGGMK